MSQSLMQLDPTLPVEEVRTGKKGRAFLVIDYGPENPLLFVVSRDEDGTVWCVAQHELRLQKNVTFGRDWAAPVPQQAMPSQWQFPIPDWYSKSVTFPLAEGSNGP